MQTQKQTGKQREREAGRCWW